MAALKDREGAHPLRRHALMLMVWMIIVVAFLCITLPPLAGEVAKG